MAKLKAQVARTAHDLDHVNHLRVPFCAVKELRLKTADGASSVSYTLSQERVQADAAGGKDTFHFAPSAEKITIFYKINDPLRRISKAKIEIFGIHEATALWQRDLKLEEYADGEHKIEWDGKITRVSALPHDFEYVTAELSPYKMKLTIAADEGVKGEPPCAFTYFHVLIKEIELELGDKTVLSDLKDKKLYDTLGGKLPKEGDKQELVLESNLFKTNGGEMEDNTAYEQYRTLWSHGPLVPIFLKIYIADSKDQKVDTPKAIGNVKFLWDWEDVAEVHPAGLKAAATTFIDDALNFDKQNTKPKGDNCHLERGGKRGPDAAAVFPAQAGQNPPPAALTPATFPFRVEPCSKRKWAAYSYAHGEGAMAGKTGVLFQPSRMAGDSYKLTVYLAYHRKPDNSIILDIEDNAPLKAVMKKSTGTFEVWREVHLIRYKQKRATVTPIISVAKVQGYYQKAFLHLADMAGAPTPMAKADYNSQMTSVVNAQPWYVRMAVDAVDQYDSGDHFIHYRNHASWKAQVDAYFTAQGWNNAAKTAWSAGIMDSDGNSDPYANSSVYHRLINDWALTMIPLVCDKFISTDNGINIFHFNNLYNTPLPFATSLNGFAADLPSANRNRCGFIQCGSNYGGTGSLNTREQTCTHEVGHHLFLPHTWQVSPTHDPQGTHDKADSACTMSYQFGSVREFCGLCLLRLRGWSKFQADKTGTTNATRTLKDTPAGSNSRT